MLELHPHKSIGESIGYKGVLDHVIRKGVLSTISRVPAEIAWVDMLGCINAKLLKDTRWGHLPNTGMLTISYDDKKMSFSRDELERLFIDHQEHIMCTFYDLVIGEFKRQYSDSVPDIDHMFVSMITKDGNPLWFHWKERDKVLDFLNMYSDTIDKVIVTEVTPAKLRPIKIEVSYIKEILISEVSK